MTKLIWTKIKSNMPTGESYIWYRSIYEKNFSLNYKKFGDTWGTGILETGIFWKFSIHPRNIDVRNINDFKYQLLISGLSVINGHVYVHSVDDGKKIAQEICDYFIEKIKSIK